jgi:hypothetical protein
MYGIFFQFMPVRSIYFVFIDLQNDNDDNDNNNYNYNLYDFRDDNELCIFRTEQVCVGVFVLRIVRNHECNTRNTDITKLDCLSQSYLMIMGHSRNGVHVHKKK